jgi:hypothetical protein
MKRIQIACHLNFTVILSYITRYTIIKGYVFTYADFTTDKIKEASKNIGLDLTTNQQVYSFLK